jgi:uncharacterized protein YraI
MFALLAAGCGATPGTAMMAPGGADASGPGGADASGTLDVTPDVTPDGGAPAPGDDLGVAMLEVGATARVVASALNLRTGPGTTNPIITAMPCGAQVNVIGGPTSNWWNVTWMGQTGWSSGRYLVPEAAFDPAVCAQPDAGVGDLGPISVDQASIIGRAKLGVGYSYYWGHGSWRTDGMDPGACFGTCPNCTHNGQYGADCSGFVAKCWQIPLPSALTDDLHPYSTYNFYNQTTHWSQIPRSQIQTADALVYNANGAGHIMLFESGADPWGNIWTYEARGCATGIVHNLRVAGTTYIAIRREGL